MQTMLIAIQSNIQLKCFFNAQFANWIRLPKCTMFCSFSHELSAADGTLNHINFIAYVNYICNCQTFKSFAKSADRLSLSFQRCEIEQSTITHTPV